MALIGKIRNNMWLVIVLLAVALGGFILMDMMSASNRGSFGSQTILGEVNGRKIDYIDFQRTEAALYSGGGEQYSKKNTLWNYFIEDAVIKDIADKTGIGVGVDELSELEFGTNLSPIIQSFFRNPQTGQVDRKQLSDIKTAIDEDKVENPEFANTFNELRKQVVKSQKQTKLAYLVSKSMYTPTWYAETMDKLNNEVASVEFVKIPYSSIDDESITITDEEYAAYIKENETKYTLKEEARNIAYLVYDVKPTLNDSNSIYQELFSLKDGFASSTNDSLFAVSNEGFYSNQYSKKDDLTGTLKDSINKVGVGQVYGPYINSNMYVLAKLHDRKVVADSAKISHILRNVQSDNPGELLAARAYIDSVKLVIENGGQSFEDAAATNSQDPGSSAKGGDLGSFAPGVLPAQFDNAIFNGKKGGLYVVSTQSGVHLLKVTDLIFESTDLKYNFAYIARPILASEETQNTIQDKVISQLESIKTIEDLKKLETDGIKVEIASNIKKNDYAVSNLGAGQTSRDIIKWAFDENVEIGEVSPTTYVYRDEANYVDSKYVIASLKSINKAGLGDVETLKSEIEPKLKNKKKAEIIKSKITSKDLITIASSFAQTVTPSEGITYGRGGLQGTGSEPKVIGKIFAMEPGTVSDPIAGDEGVFVVKVIAKEPSTSESGAYAQKVSLTLMARNQVNSQLMESLKKNIKIEDNRFNFF